MPSITSWNRLEPRARSAEMLPGLQARIADPLWLLGRQWQVGEFQGEDAGSPVWARVRAQASPMNAIRGAASTAPFSAQVPLEVQVQAEQPDTSDLDAAAQGGLHFRHLLRARSLDRYAAAVLARCPLPAPASVTDPAARARLRVSAGRVADGAALAGQLAAWRSWLTVDPAHTQAFDAVAATYRSWWAARVPTSAVNDFWAPDRFEYRVALATGTAAAPVTLRAAEHDGGSLDWHSFDHVTTEAMAGSAAAQDVVSTTLVSPATFPGMPAPRFWELEDSRVDFGSIPAESTDLARMLVLDFATLYGNDWQVLPCTLPVGSLTRISSVVIGDTFGGRWLVQAGTDPGWSMFTCTAVGADGAATGRLAQLFLPPSVGQVLEGEPLEELLLLRDEDANVAWGMERVVQVGGGRVDRDEQWRQQQARSGAAPEHVGATERIADRAYRLAVEVPPHWIPLVPRDGDGGRTLLRVSPVRRPGSAGPVDVLPEGRLLGARPALDVPSEEVPLEGARVTRSWRYARDVDGRTHIWVGRRKAAGRGPASSGLAFDQVEPWTPPVPALAFTVESTWIGATLAADEPLDPSALPPNTDLGARIRVRNTGTRPWYRAGENAALLITSTPMGHAGRLAAATWLDSAHPARLIEPVVLPGATATFAFQIRTPAQPGPFAENYEPVLSGGGKIVGLPAALTGSVAG